jgi:hypothetical protein
MGKPERKRYGRIIIIIIQILKKNVMGWCGMN